VPIREGLFCGDLEHLETVSLRGTKCDSCNEVALAEQKICTNCGGDAVGQIALARSGVLWTYTVARNRPPGGYHGQDPFVPFGLGLVELAEGIRVYTPLEGDVQKIRIGAPANFKAFVTHTDGEGREVVGFSFAIAAKG